MLYALHRGTLAAASDKLTVAELLTFWLEQVARPSGLRPTTDAAFTYHIEIEHHLIPTALGWKQLRKLTVADVQAWIAERRAAGYAVWTIVKAKTVLG